MTTLAEIEKRVDFIEKRNKQVELDKAWETSLAHNIVITLLTYMTIVLFFKVAGLDKPLLNSIIPTRKMWVKRKS